MFFDDGFRKMISSQNDSCNGIPISEFRELANRYLFVSGVWIDFKVTGGIVTAQGRIFLAPCVPIETIERFQLDGIRVDAKVAAWLVFLHEVAHLQLNHVRHDATSEEVECAKKSVSSLPRDEKMFLDSVLKLEIDNHQSQANAWAVREYKKLKREGVLNV